MDDNSVKTTPIEDKTVSQNSRIPGGYGGTLVPVRDTQSARELANRRWDNYRKASEVVVKSKVAEVLGVEVTTKWAAWAHLVGVQAGIALEGGRGSTQAAALVARAIDAFPDKSAAVVVGGGSGGDMPIEVMAMVQAMRERAATDPEFAERVRVMAARLISGEADGEGEGEADENK